MPPQICERLRNRRVRQSLQDVQPFLQSWDVITGPSTSLRSRHDFESNGRSRVYAAKVGAGVILATNA
jgi:hypothetical protein